VAHLGTWRGVGSPRENKWCDLDSDCPSNCLAQATCDGGPTPGGTCDSDRDCDPNQQCDNGKIDICQGPSVLNQSGAYRPGDLELEVPMTAKLAVAPGPDGQYCTADDTYALSGVGLDSILRLTTGKATATISDVNYTDGVTMGASEEGAPFNCDEWQNNKNLSGGRLVGALTFLNVPSTPFKGDTILTFRFQADTQACVGGTCPQPCTDDVQCSDADPCNGREFCYLNTCQPGVPVTCDDGNQCNGLEACNQNSGLCDPSNGVACDDDNPCTTGTCRPDFLCTYHNEPDGKACNDGDLCTGPDPVTGGICTINNCDHCETGVCTGSPTTQTPGQPGAPAAECENNNRCDGIMACDPATGNSCIQKVPPLTCVADTNPCTDDVCDPALGCNPPSPVTTACDDGSLCTVNDHCDGQRQCVGDPLECQQPASVCDGFNSCNRLSGACELTPLDCNDLNPCTIDSCFDDGTKTPATACVHDAPGAAGLACDDQSACTDTDQCNATGQCVGTLSAAAALCNVGDGDACNGTEACDPVGGGCLKTPLNCDDAEPCTMDSCDPTVGCQHDQLTGLCDDGNACTVGDTCASGACLGAPTQVALTCGNTTVCDGIETCDPGSGTCLPGTPLVCDDSDECTTETCDPVAGCVSTAQPGLEGALCELDALREEIKGRPFGSITGKRLPRKLSRLVLRARVKVKLATRASNPKAVTLLTAADKKLQRFQILVKKGFGFDRITEALMHQTTDRTQNARTITQTYKANLR
jgi:slime mold repeat-containing protein